MKILKKYFFSGLIILLPVAITLAILIFLIHFLTDPFMGVMIAFLEKLNITLSFSGLSHYQIVYHLSQFLILLIFVLITLLLGVFGRWFFFHSILKWWDIVLNKIPVFNKIYKTSQEIVKTIFLAENKAFKQVVLVPFPRKGVYSLGLVSREAPIQCQDANFDLITVFIATTPNPTTGFLLMYKKEDIIYLDIKTEEAIKYIVSCGVIVPKEKDHQ